MKVIILGGGDATGFLLKTMLESKGILVCDDDYRHNVITLRAGHQLELISRESVFIPSLNNSFTPPHKKNRRSKFKRSGK